MFNSLALPQYFNNLIFFQALLSSHPQHGRFLCGKIQEIVKQNSNKFQPGKSDTNWNLRNINLLWAYFDSCLDNALLSQTSYAHVSMEEHRNIEAQEW